MPWMEQICTYVVMDKLIVFAPLENMKQPTKVTGTIQGWDNP